jgi:hypothetical protein
LCAHAFELHGFSSANATGHWRKARFTLHLWINQIFLGTCSEGKTEWKLQPNIIGLSINEPETVLWTAAGGIERLRMSGLGKRTNMKQGRLAPPPEAIL